MRIDFADRIVVVTGGSGGIGAAIASRFTEAGASVVTPTREDLDVRSPDAVRSWFARPSNAGIDVLVNNAGVYPGSGLVDMTAETWRDVLDTNLTGAHSCTQAAARLMMAHGRGGAIVNVASIEALGAARAHSHYVASKAGLVAYTRAAALELGPSNIRVNAVSPGLIARNGLEEAWPEGVASFVARAPLGRLGTADDIASACLFLASDEARFITGANLVVDGGALTAPAF